MPTRNIKPHVFFTTTPTLFAQKYEHQCYAEL